MKTQLGRIINNSKTAISKKFLLVACAATVLVTSAFASGEAVNKKAANSLKREFADAENISWKVTPNYTKASFNWNDQKLEVFYNKEGETIAQSREIKFNVLPLNAQRYINSRYSDYQLTEAIEYDSDQTGHCYFLSYVKNNQKTILQVYTEGTVEVFKPEQQD